MIQPYDSIIVRKIVRVLVPLIQLFALYVFFHGHHSPGGGFQAGVLIGASLILKLLVGTPEETGHLSLKQELTFASLGLAIYAGVGLLAVQAGSQYLNYGEIPLFGPDFAFRRFLGILSIEFGVMLVVAMTFVIIFRALSEFGKDAGDAS